jgi:hypothetical protein
LVVQIDGCGVLQSVQLLGGSLSDLRMAMSLWTNKKGQYCCFPNS